MSSKPHTDPVYKEKRIPKNPNKFGVQLNEEQKLAKAEILKHTITVLKGKAGSAKTLLACNVALDLLFKKEVERIYIARPFVYTDDDRTLSALPGGVAEKLQGLTLPVVDNCYVLIGKEKTEKLLAEGLITILPVAFMRGITVNNAVLILDEFQNATLSQTYAALSRIGKNSKVIVTGDMAQCDLRNKKETGFDFFTRLETEGLRGIKIIKLESNHRHELVDHISRIYDNYRD